MDEAYLPNRVVDIPLAELIQALRRELNTARSGATDQDLKFEVEKVDVELQVVVTRDATVKAGVEFWVVKAGGELTRTGKATHTFKLTLNPISTDPGGRVVVASETNEQISTH